MGRRLSLLGDLEQFLFPKKENDEYAIYRHFAFRRSYCACPPRKTAAPNSQGKPLCELQREVVVRPEWPLQYCHETLGFLAEKRAKSHFGRVRGLIALAISLCVRPFSEYALFRHRNS